MTLPAMVSMLVAVALLAAGVAAYWKNTDKVIFPALLVVGGIFLGGAQQVSASFGGVLDVKFANQVNSANDANSKALEANKLAIENLSATLTASQAAFEKYRKDVDARFRQLRTPPVAYRVPIELKQANSALQKQLKQVETANKNAIDQSKALNNLTRSLPIKQ